MVITVEKVTKQYRKKPNWKAPGKDGVPGYWIKDFGSFHEWITIQMNKTLMGDDSLPAWMMHSCIVLYQKDPRKSNAVENYCTVSN